MSISPFAIVLILIYVRIFFMNSIKKQFIWSFVLTMICSLTIYMGYFISFSTTIYYPFSIVALLLNTWFSFRLSKSNLKRNMDSEKLKKGILIYVLSCFVTILLFYTNRYQYPVILNSDYENFLLNQVGYTYLTNSSIKYGLFITSCLNLYNIYIAVRYLNIGDIINIGNLFLKISFVALVVGYIEFFTEQLFHSLFITDFTIWLMGKSGAQQHSLDLRDGWTAIQGFTREASMYSTFVFYASIIALILAKNKSTSFLKVFICLAFGLLVLNRSMSSYVYAFILISIIVYLNPFRLKHLDERNPKFALGLLVTIVLFLLTQSLAISEDSYLGQRLSSSLSEFTNFQSSSFTYSSEGIRYLSISQGLDAYFKRPFFGIGFGCVSSLSGVVALLSSIGTIGTLSFFNIFRLIVKKYKKEAFLMVIFFIFLPNLLINDYQTMLAMVIPFIFVLLSVLYRNINPVYK